MMQHKPTTEHIGWFDALQTHLKFNTLIDYIKLSKNQIIELGICAGAGFLCGFLCKRYAHYVLCGIVFIIGIVLLAQLGIFEIVIRWDVVYKLIGLKRSHLHTDTVTTCFEWMKIHIWMVLSFFIGFFLSLKYA